MQVFKFTGIKINRVIGSYGLKACLTAILAANFFLACGKDKDSKPSPEPKDPLKILAEDEELPKPSRIVTINSLSEDFSSLSWRDAALELKGHDKLGSSSVSCQSPNQITRFEELIYVVCSLSHQIFVFSKNMVLQKVMDVGNGSNPMELVIINANLAFVTLFNTDQVLVFRPKLQLETGEQRILATINLRGLNYHNDSGEAALPKPAGLAASNGKIFVAVANLTANWTPAGLGQLVVIDQKGLQVKSILSATGYNSAKIVVETSSPLEEKMYVLNSGSWADNGNIDVFDPKTEKLIGSADTKGAPTRMVIDVAANRAYVGDSSKAEVMELSLRDLNILRRVNLQENRCNDFKAADFSYISDLLLMNEYLFVSEFNSDCLLVLEKDSLKALSATRVGDGPLAIFELE
ncbi:MAG: hypothetical protein KBD78_03795 [Oligoflexales bacterium]|nr:hypothetical protein [Oligoflexales bacterium]